MQIIFWVRRGLLWNRSGMPSEKPDTLFGLRMIETFISFKIIF